MKSCQSWKIHCNFKKIKKINRFLSSNIPINVNFNIQVISSENSIKKLSYDCVHVRYVRRALREHIHNHSNQLCYIIYLIEN